MVDFPNVSTCRETNNVCQHVEKPVFPVGNTNCI